MNELDTIILALRLTHPKKEYRLLEYQGEHYIFSRDGDRWDVDAAAPMDLYQGLVSAGMAYIF